MNRRGFSLAELVIIIAIIGILLSVTALQFIDYIQKGAIERQTKELHADLMTTRTEALTQRSLKRVVVTPTAFSFISSTLGGGVSSGRVTKVLSKPVTWSGGSSEKTEMEITFDERGIFSVDSGNGTTICVNQSTESAWHDTLVLSTTRIHMGKVSFGGACLSENVTIR